MEIKEAIQILTELTEKGETEIHGSWYCREYVENAIHCNISKEQWSKIVDVLRNSDDRPDQDTFVETVAKQIMGIEAE